MRLIAILLFSLNIQAETIVRVMALDVNDKRMILETVNEHDYDTKAEFWTAIDSLRDDGRYNQRVWIEFNEVDK